MSSLPIEVDKMQVIKAGIPEMPGDFGGGN